MHKPAVRSELSRRESMQANDNNRPRRAPRWWLTAAGAAAFGGAAVFSGVVESPLVAQDPKPKVEEKKADPAKPDAAPKFDPKDVRVGPPPELSALRQAVEEAAKK